MMSPPTTGRGGRVTQTADHEQAVVLERREGIATILLNRPARLNAMSTAVWQGIAEAARAADADPEIGVVLIRGMGRAAFSAGADIGEFEEQRSTPERAL